MKIINKFFFNAFIFLPTVGLTQINSFTKVTCSDCNKNNPIWSTNGDWDPAHGLAVGSTTGSATLIAVGRNGKNGGTVAVPPVLVEYRGNELKISANQLPNTGIIAANGNHTNKILIGDFNGDGIEDIFSANAGLDRDPFPGQLNTLWAKSDGNWNAVPITGQNTSFNHSAAVIDLDHNGVMDILVGLGSISINQNNYSNYAISFSGNQFTTSTQMVDQNLNMFVVASGDVNGDGLADIVYGSYEQQGRPYSGSGVLVRNANGSFTKVLFPRPAGVLAHAAGVPAIGDINGDGLADVVMLYTPAWPSKDRYRKPIIQVLLQTAAGQWVDASNDLLVPYPNFDWSESYSTKAYLSDINGDGRRDLILEVSEKRWQDRRAWIRIFENTNGKLIEKELFLGQDQSRIHVVDIDNNGKDDILINQRFNLTILIQN